MNRQALVGRSHTMGGLVVDEQESAAYAVATVDEPVSGTASPFYAVRLVAGLWRQVYQAPELDTSDARVLHAEQRMHFVRDLRLGERLDARAEVTSVVGFGFGDGVVIRSALADADGRDVVRMDSVLAVQGTSGRPPERDVVTAPARCELALRLDRHFGDATPQLYADAADDHNPLHLDDALAREAGHPGRIVHGMCTLATGISGLVATLRSHPRERLEYVTARFSRPVMPGTTIQFTAHRGDADGTYLVGARHDGKPVLKNAWFRLARA